MPAEHPLYSKLARILTLSEEEAAAARAVPVESVPIKAHQSIAREGDKPSRSSLVRDGMVCTSKVIAGGKRQIMALHMRGDGRSWRHAPGSPGQGLASDRLVGPRHGRAGRNRVSHHREWHD